MLTLFALGMATFANCARAGEFEEALETFASAQYGRSHELLLGLAERGQARAQLMVMGDFYAGWGISPDYIAAREWGFQAQRGAEPSDFDFVIGRWRTMAESGDARAQMLLGTLYNSGFGLPMDEAQAFRWIKLSADQGNARGQYALGTLYQFGRGVERNDATAAEWYRKAAERGNPSAL